MSIAAEPSQERKSLSLHPLRRALTRCSGQAAAPRSNQLRCLHFERFRYPKVGKTSCISSGDNLATLERLISDCSLTLFWYKGKSIFNRMLANVNNNYG